MDFDTNYSDEIKIRKASSAVGAIMLLFVVFIFVYQIVLFFGINILYNDNFAFTEKGLKTAAKFYYNFLPNMPMIENFTIQILSLITSLGIVSRFYKFQPLSIISPQKAYVNNEFVVGNSSQDNKSFILKMVRDFFPIILAINYITSIIIDIIIRTIEDAGVSVPEVDFTFDKNTIANLFVYFISLCVFAPLIEEFLFRGCLLKILKPFGNWFAVIIPAIFFALLHGNMGQGFGAFFIGVILGYVTVKSNSILPAIFLHSLNNFTQFFFGVLLNIKGYDSIKNIFSLGFLILVLYGVYLIIKKTNEFKLENSNFTTLSTKQLYKTLFTNVFVILYIALETYLIIRSFMYYNK